MFNQGEIFIHSFIVEQIYWALTPGQVFELSAGDAKLNQQPLHLRGLLLNVGEMHIEDYPILKWE